MTTNRTQGGNSMDSRRGKRKWLRLLALLAALAMIMAACGSDDDEDGDATATDDAATDEAADDGAAEEDADDAPAEEEDDGDAAAEEDADDGAADEAAGDFGIDLTGQSIRMTSPEASPLQMGQYLVLDKLSEWGAETELITIVSTTGIQALVADQADIAPHGADELVLGAAEGADATAIGAPEAQLNYVIVTSVDNPDVASLAGKNFGMSGPAGFDALIGRFAVSDAGLDPASDVNFVQIGGSPDRAAALLAGQIDAVTIFADDWINLDQQTDDLHVIMRATDIVQGIPGSLYMGRSEYWNENEDVAFATACANLEVNKWIQENRDDFIAYAMDNVEGIEQAAVEEIYDFAMEVNMFPTAPEEVLTNAGMDDLMSAMLETGDISSEVDMTSHVDTSYLEQAVAAGCGQ